MYFYQHNGAGNQCERTGNKTGIDNDIRQTALVPKLIVRILAQILLHQRIACQGNAFAEDGAVDTAVDGDVFQFLTVLILENLTGGREGCFHSRIIVGSDS